MAIRLIAGRAGSGKTHWCQSQICTELGRSLIEGPRLIMLVPEQAALLMERGLLTMSAAQALGRSEVLSFRRLAHRILTESIIALPTPLTPTGRQMALRHLLNRHREKLREFSKVAQRPGFVAELSRSVTELLQESVTLDQMQSCATAALEADDPSASKLHDITLLYEAYLKYLGSDRVDPEGVLDLARSHLGDAKWLENASIWIDGFAGLTQQQVRICVDLAKVATHIDIALLLDPEADLKNPPPDESISLFARTEHTWAILAQAAREAGVTIDKPLYLGSKEKPRFANSLQLAQIEQAFFAPTLSPKQLASSGQLSFSFDAAPATLPIKNDTFKFLVAPHARAEVEAIAANILDLVQRENNPLRYRDIAIIVRDLAPYHDLISATFRTHNIPHFIDRRHPTFHHPLVQLVRAVLTMHGNQFEQAMTLLLKSGLASIRDDEADALENYVLAHGITRTEAWDQPWTLPVNPDRDERKEPGPFEVESLEKLNSLRESLRAALGEWWPTDETKRGRPAASTWVERLYALMERLGVRRQLLQWCREAEQEQRLEEAEEHQQVWADLVKLLDEFVSALGDERMTARQFRDVIEAGLAEFTLGLVPPTLDQVLVGSIERSRHPAVRAAFVLGFNEGQFPAQISEQSILGDQERKFFAAQHVQLSRTRNQRILDERMLAYIAVTRPSEMLFVSCVQSDAAGRPLPPSPYWQLLRDAVPEAQEETITAGSITDISEIQGLAGGLSQNLRDWVESKPHVENVEPWLALYNWARTSSPAIQAIVAHALASLPLAPQASLTAGAAAALWRAPYKTSVTRLETFAACQFQHFAKYGLRLDRRRRHEISPIQMGQLYHSVLEQFVNHLIETQTNLSDLSPAQIADNLTRLCAQILPEWAIKLNLSEDEHGRVRWRSHHELPIALAGQKSTVGRTPLKPHGTEQQFGGDDQASLPALVLQTKKGEVLVRGKIDRMDLLDVGGKSLAVVYDYKRSTGRMLYLDEVLHGLSLQLLAYLLVIRDHLKISADAKVIPGGAFYLPILGPRPRVDHPSEADDPEFHAFKDFKPRGIFDFDWIQAFDPTLTAGWSRTFNSYRSRSGELGNANSNDGVERDALAAVLEHVRTKMTELAESWIGGEIAVAPFRMEARPMPCVNCNYRAVCRFELNSPHLRRLNTMPRTEAIQQIIEGSKPLK